MKPLFILPLILISLSALGQTQENSDKLYDFSREYNLKLLKDLPLVSLGFLDLPLGLFLQSPSKDEVISFIELELTRTGIRTSKEFDLNGKMLPHLYVRIDPQGDDLQVFIEIREEMIISRNRESTHTVSYSIATFHKFSKSPTQSEIVSIVKKRITDFCIDWLKANPKK